MYTTKLIPNRAPKKKIRNTITYQIKYKLKVPKVITSSLRHSITLPSQSRKGNTDSSISVNTSIQSSGRKPKAQPNYFDIELHHVDTSVAHESNICVHCNKPLEQDYDNGFAICISCGNCSPCIYTDVTMYDDYYGDTHMMEDIDRLFKKNNDYDTATHFLNCLKWGLGIIAESKHYDAIMDLLQKNYSVPVSLVTIEKLLRQKRFPQQWKRYAAKCYHDINQMDNLPFLSTDELFMLKTVHDKFVEFYHTEYTQFLKHSSPEYINVKNRKYMIPYTAQIHFILQNMQRDDLLVYFPLPIHPNTLLSINTFKPVINRICQDNFSIIKNKP